MSTPVEYASSLIRLWREQQKPTADWHSEVEHIQSGRRWMFSALDELLGFLRYASGDQVRIAYHATHPANFATFRFWIRRGVQIVSNVRGEVSVASVAYQPNPPKSPLHSYGGDGGGNFEKSDFSTGELLGPCAEAAFVEILRVYAKATNGWDRIEIYDAHHERAFALALETT